MSQVGITAVACVSDSSLIIAAEWYRILTEYLGPMLNRLVENPLLTQPRLAFITYGLASTRPSPLLCERFFQLPAEIQPELKDHAGRLGIGQTGLGSNAGGMSALEGLVAALEMFDMLRSSVGLAPGSTRSGPRINLTSHVIHFAAGPPDDAEHPVWNKNPKLDSVTWNTLPDEFKARDIHYSVILVKPLPRFKEIFSSMPAGGESTVTPWFNVAPSHTVLLSGFPTKGAKRPHDATSASPEQKRPRQDSTSKSTVPTNTVTKSTTSPLPISIPTIVPPPSNTASVPVQVPAPAQASVPGQTWPPTGAQRPVFSQLSLQQQQQLAERYRLMQVDMQRDVETMKKLTQEGKSQETIANMRRDFQTKYERFKKLSLMLGVQNNASGMATSTSAQSASVPQPLPGSIIPKGEAGPSTVPVSNNNNVASSGSSAAPVPMPMPEHQGGNNVGAMSMNNKQYPPEIMAQIGKLVEQQGRQNASINTQPMLGANQTAPPPSSTQIQTVAKWQGTLSWAGLNPVTDARREMTIAVIGQCSTNASDPQTYTWPSNLHLVPSQENIDYHPDFQEWVKKHKPALCHFMPLAIPGIDAKQNESGFRQLTQFLIEKHPYALAAWDLPNGMRNSNNLLVFPYKTGGLIGAVFPSTGIPELPKPMSAPVPVPTQPQNPQSLEPAQFMAQLSKMPPERQQLMRQWLLHKQQEQARLRTLAAASGGEIPASSSVNDNANSGNAQFPIRINAPPFNGVALPMGMSMQQNQPGAAGNAQQGIPGVSLEMMHSFMQRKVDGSDGQQPPGMN